MESMTRAICVLAITLAPGCPGGDEPTCGVPNDAAPAGATMTAEGIDFVYGGFSAGHARDCGEESTTIDGVQEEPAPAAFHLTLCVHRGDRIGTAPLDLSDETEVDLVDASGQQGDCIYAIDFDTTPTGTVRFEGYCDAGGSSFLMTIDGSVGGIETCTATGMTSTTLTLSGSSVVAFPQP
jgi:hypothetical protein